MITDILDLSNNIKSFVLRNSDRRLLYSFSLFKCPLTSNFFLKIDYFLPPGSTLSSIPKAEEKKINDKIVRSVKNKFRSNNLLFYNRSFQDSNNVPKCKVFMDCFNSSEEFFYQNLKTSVLKIISMTILGFLIYYFGAIPSVLTLFNTIVYFLVNKFLGLNLIQRLSNLTTHLTNMMSSLWKEFIENFFEKSDFIKNVKDKINLFFNPGTDNSVRWIGSLNVVFKKKRHQYQEAKYIFDQINQNHFVIKHQFIQDEVKKINRKLKKFTENMELKSIVLTTFKDILIDFFKKLKEFFIKTPKIKQQLQNHRKNINLDSNSIELFLNKTNSFQDYPISCIQNNDHETIVKVDPVFNSIVNIYDILQATFQNISYTNKFIKADKNVLKFSLVTNTNIISDQYIYIESIYQNQKVVLNAYVSNQRKIVSIEDIKNYKESDKESNNKFFDGKILQNARENVKKYINAQTLTKGKQRLKKIPQKFVQTVKKGTQTVKKGVQALKNADLEEGKKSGGLFLQKTFGGSRSQNKIDFLKGAIPTNSETFKPIPDQKTEDQINNQQEIAKQNNNKTQKYKNLDNSVKISYIQPNRRQQINQQTKKKQQQIQKKQTKKKQQKKQQINQQKHQQTKKKQQEQRLNKMDNLKQKLINLKYSSKMDEQDKIKLFFDIYKNYPNHRFDHQQSQIISNFLDENSTILNRPTIRRYLGNQYKIEEGRIKRKDKTKSWLN